MTIDKRAQRGVDVHFEPEECDVFMKLASDAEKVNGEAEAPIMYSGTAQSYFSLSLALGKQFRAIAAADGAPGR